MKRLQPMAVKRDHAGSELTPRTSQQRLGIVRQIGSIDPVLRKWDFLHWTFDDANHVLMYHITLVQFDNLGATIMLINLKIVGFGTVRRESTPTHGKRLLKCAITTEMLRENCIVRNWTALREPFSRTKRLAVAHSCQGLYNLALLSGG